MTGVSFTRGRRPSDIILDEEPSYRSRRVVNVLPITGFIASNGTALKAGRILLRRRIQAVGSVSFSSGAPTGKGNLTLHPTFRAWKGPAIPGDYSFRCVSTATNGGVFELTAPDGRRLQTVSAGTVGSAQTVDNELLTGMRILDGAVDYQVGDAFFLTLVESPPVWEVALNDDHTTTSQPFLDPVILIEDVREGQPKGIVVTREARIRAEYVDFSAATSWPEYLDAFAAKGIVFE
jgi:hypothetical protein